MEMRALNPRSEAGFTLIEGLIAILVSVVAMVGLLSLFSLSIAVVRISEEDNIAKQKAREALESIYTARNTQQITFDMIDNVSNGGIFLDGFQPLREPNPPGGDGDGIVGTADDGDIESIRLPGKDGILGTEHDEIRVLSNFEREIRIEPVADASGDGNPDVRRIIVTIRYDGRLGGQREYVIESHISRFR